MTIEERLQALRERLREEGLDSFIITGTDPHQSEYPADRWRSRAYFSGFTGSAGDLLVEGGQAFLWTDSRYFIQAADELDGTGIILMKEGMEGVPSLEEHLSSSAVKGMKVGIDGDTVSIGRFRRLSAALAAKGAALEATDGIISSVWKGRPPVPDTKAYRVDERYAYTPMAKKIGIAARNRRKLSLVRSLLEKHEGEQILIIGQYLDQLEEIRKTFGFPLITGSMRNTMRDELYQAFREGRIRVLIVSKVANFAIDLPDASVAIQVSGTFGSRQEEAQRLGRILRPKSRDSHFYTLVSRNTREEEFSLNRQKFLIEQGYSYSVENVN